MFFGKCKSKEREGKGREGKGEGVSKGAFESP
jgi:hypothetical protein